MKFRGKILVVFACLLLAFVFSSCGAHSIGHGNRIDDGKYQYVFPNGNSITITVYGDKMEIDELYLDWLGFEKEHIITYEYTYALNDHETRIRLTDAANEEKWRSFEKRDGGFNFDWYGVTHDTGWNFYQKIG